MNTSEAERCRRSESGRKSRANGLSFEDIIKNAAEFYEKHGIAIIDKNAEPMKVLNVYSRNKGQFICCFSKKAKPDFEGILCDSTMILFDAKHTDKEKIRRDVITEEQEKCFERYMQHGAMCFLVVSIGFEKYFRVPWVVFRDMKLLFGHKFMTIEELRPYEIKYSKGILRFLDGVELRERIQDEDKQIGSGESH